MRTTAPALLRDLEEETLGDEAEMDALTRLSDLFDRAES